MSVRLYESVNVPVKLKCKPCMRFTAVMLPYIFTTNSVICARKRWLKYLENKLCTCACYQTFLLLFIICIMWHCSRRRSRRHDHHGRLFANLLLEEHLVAFEDAEMSRECLQSFSEFILPPWMCPIAQRRSTLCAFLFAHTLRTLFWSPYSCLHGWRCSVLFRPIKGDLGDTASVLFT